LTCDPNLTGRTYTTAVIAPDTSTDYGFQGTLFAGIFDGDGHIVSNLTIDTVGAGNDYLGLFGHISGYSAEIENLGVENINITSGTDSDYLGSLCGRNSYGTISDCYATGSLTGGDGSRDLGGLCGHNLFSTISNCHATGSVNGGDNSESLGGLCGYSSGDATITNCYATGSVTGGDYSNALGGLCGYNDSRGIIINCYATGSVTGGDGSRGLGGLCGYNSHGTITNCYAASSVTGGDNSFYLGGLCGCNAGTIGNCYSEGSVTGDNNLGGLCGYNNSYGRITNCFWDVETSGMSVSDGGTGKTTAEMQMQSTFTDAGWDFTNETANGTSQIWQMPTGGGYPVLSNFNGYTPMLLNGDGTEASPYLINDAAELGAIYHYNSNACFRLQSDIDLTGIRWSIAIVPVFSGCFDGNGYVIYNLNIEGGNYLGLFGKLSGYSAEVKNLGIENINIIGGAEYLGGLCGYNDEGTITNCYATGSVTGGADAEYLGGLCGYNGGTITNCYSSGSVIGGYDSDSLGGLCGCNYGTITNCYAAGSVTGGDDSGYLGGLCGLDRGTITNCYATGSVIGGDDSMFLGGLCGHNLFGTISNCHATGSVNGGDNSESLGGLCGCNYFPGIINDCYATGSVTGDNYLGGLCGGNGGRITNCYATSSVIGGDYSSRLGGLCGLNVGRITNCYATGLVTGGDSSEYLGGLCGYSDESTISNCFWDIETSGMTDGVGNQDPDPAGVIGKTTLEMQTQSTFTDACWDFFGEDINGTDDFWDICEGTNYPKLSWQFLAGDFLCPDGVDLRDFAVLAETWSLSSGQAGYNDLCDLMDDDTIDLNDLAVFVENWLGG
ncbi:MAG: hypothetical protein KAJ46_03405, partial [Sedimentisphaerales bacterium]|nr:hypothetical protein [Sedimentisphaerales bacterium]